MNPNLTTDGPLERPTCRRTAWLAVTFTALGSAANYFLASHRIDDVAKDVCLGIFSSELYLIGFASVLGPWPTCKRLSLLTLVSIAICSAWGVGRFGRDVFGHFDVEHIEQAPAFVRQFVDKWKPVLLVLPLILFSFQLPPWLARSWLRWRIEQPATRPTAPPGLRISHLLFATAYVAVVLTASRLALAETGTAPDLRVLEMWGVIVGVMIVVSLITTAVVVPVALRTRFAAVPAFAISVLTAQILICPLLVLTLLVNAMIVGVRLPSWLKWLDIFHGIVSVSVPVSCTSIPFAVTVSGFLLWARRLGYRLVWN